MPVQAGFGGQVGSTINAVLGILILKAIGTRAVESESREKSKNRKKSDKIGSDFLSDFFAKKYLISGDVLNAE